MKLLLLAIIFTCLSFSEVQAQGYLDGYLSDTYPSSPGYQPRITQPMRKELGRYHNQRRKEQQAADHYWGEVHRENQRAIDERRLNSTYPKYNNPYVNRVRKHYGF